VSSRTFAIAALIIATLPAAAQAKLAAPKLVGPLPNATVESLPTFTWGKVKHSDHYEFQLSADRDFASIALGSGNGLGTFKTKNLAATTTRSVPDGDYYWRIRAVTVAGNAGKWSPARHLVKAWTTPPALQTQNPLDVSWPSLPLVLRWSAVPFAVKYQLTIATDELLTTPVIGTATKPVETQGMSYALDAALPPGQYFWAVTPVDAEGHKGARSVIGQFNWTWPTGSSTRVTDLNPDPQVFDPQFSWDPIPGAARYEVEVNAAEGFPADAKWCCTDPTIGTSLSPTKVLANNTYYWRMRAVDSDGNFGAWNIGPSFEKSFDKVTPSIANVRMIDVNGNTINANPGIGEPAHTDTPIIAWDPVPGAVKYEVQIGNFTGTWNSGGCSFNLPDQTTFTSVPYLTFTAHAPYDHIGPAAWPGAHDKDSVPTGSTKYCIRVRAYSDEDAHNNPVISASFTQLNGANHPAFQFDDPPPVSPSPTAGALHAVAGTYILPGLGSPNTRTPLFTWNRVADAEGYYVVVARDEDFSKIADIAYTEEPAYAPRNDGTLGDNPIPYLDETTSYYWVVIPFKATHTPDLDDLPETQHGGSADPPYFQKLSLPPTPLSPVQGATVSTQLEFHWTATEAARNYTLQVAGDPTFSDVLDTITTDSTAYTSSSTYPTDTQLYWRVRANDVNKRPLRWSEEHPTVATFERVLPAPTLSPDNPSGGGDIPVLTWSPVNGAISYGLHVDQADGTSKDFTLASTAFTPTQFYGTGIWRWKVRANFPTDSFKKAAGAFTKSIEFVRTLDAPTGVKGEKLGGRFIVSWDYDRIAKQYKIDISKTDSFENTVESATTQNLSWAPVMTNPAFTDGGRLYWRVAVVDSGNNIGAYKMGSFVLPKGMRISIFALLSKGKSARLPISVTDAKGKAVRGARVTITGAGIRTKRATTNRKGKANVTIRPRKRGTITVVVRKKGFADGSTTLKVK
jgi:hypothetical protein